MTVDEAISAAEQVLPGNPAPDGQRDSRWQAVIAVGNFVETEPEAVWRFALRWGVSTDADLRTAIATCLLEHLLEYHFDAFITRFEQEAQRDVLFADAVSRCWKIGQAEEPGRSERFDRLLAAASGGRTA